MKKPTLGEKKEKISFALFPIKIEDQWIWLKEYIVIYEYKKFYNSYDVVISEGFLTEKYYTRYFESIDWKRIGRKLKLDQK